MKLKTFFLLILATLLFTTTSYAQDAGLTSIMSQNKIRTCLTAKIAQGASVGTGGNKEFRSSVKLTGSCGAPKGCEIWQYHSTSKKWAKVLDNVPMGPIDRTLSGTYVAHTSYQWYAIGDAPTASGEGGLEEENQTQVVGQVSQFEFPTEGDEKCVGIHWDPFGRVFDAVSLEPMSDINVSLFQNASKSLVALPNNPALTDERGVYNILVDKEDDYYLNVIAPSTHSFIPTATLDPNYDKIYSHIYKPGEVFHEAPLPASIPEDFDFGPYHHDIPLQPKGQPYRGAVAQVFEDSLIQVDLGSFVNYSGKVTFPLAQVCLVGETTGVVDCTNADNYGNFNLSVDRVVVPQEFVEIKVEKVDLTNLR